ncbi:MAG: amidohydrolase [Desulfovibrio sp.]
MALKPWPLANVEAGVATDLVVPTPSLEVAVIGLIVCNTDPAATADVVVTLTTADNTILATILMASLTPGESIHIDTKVCIAASDAPDKLRALSNVAAVSFLASGDEG